MELVSVEHSRSRRGHACTAWVWVEEQWQPFEAPGCYPSQQEATAAAYAEAVVGLGVPVPKECLLSEEAKAKQRARGAEEKKRQQAAEQRQEVIAAAMRELEEELLKALFPDAGADPDGFRTPRETEDEPMPEPLPPRLLLPAPAEARPGEERNARAAQQLKQLVKREQQVLQGPATAEAQRQVPGGGLVHVCACALIFDRSVAIVGTAQAAKRGAARAAAAAAALARLDTAASLPSREEAGELAAAVMEIRRLQQLQPFKVWAFEGVRPNDCAQWYAAVWGQVPFQGRLREFWGEGAAAEKHPATAAACDKAAQHLSRLLGHSDCLAWLKAMARVTMEVDDVPTTSARSLDADAAEIRQEYERRLQTWLAEKQKAGSALAAEPPDLEAGPAPATPQLYEMEGRGLEAAKTARGVPKLPVQDLRGALGEALGDSACLVVSGGTGSGKSTQIPQYIVDDFRPEGQGGTPSSCSSAPAGADDGPVSWRWPARVVVTEPRRIAAVSLAERVAWERGEPLGRSVGYSVRGDARPPSRSFQGGTMEFCTVGILLRRLQVDPGLRQVSHVVVDEVHERDLMTDFLLVLLKELLCVRGDLRVVLMSATLDVRTFSSYLWDCPCLEIPTGPRYPVQEVHLEDDFFCSARWAGDLPAQLLRREEEARRAAEEARSEVELAEADGEPPEEQGYQSSTGVWWGSFENDDTYMDLLVRLVLHLADGPALTEDADVPGSVLCFLPGWAEIKICMDSLQERDRQRQRLWVLPLHSTLQKAEQQLIFQHPPPGKTKVILGTNIAESSVTIDDVLVVIDAGLMREVSYDPLRHLSTLETVWVSQSSAIQRMGRAGRVREGRCFRLYSRAQLEQAPWRTTPEMQRCELSSTCLQALALRREARDFLARAPDPPSRVAVETALEELLRLGAICPEGPDGERAAGRGVMRERMLPLGEAISRMTVSPVLGRMLILGALFGAVDEACLLAAVIAAPRRVFACPPGKKKESLACVRGFSATSDVLAAYRACQDFEGWRAARSDAFAERWAGDLFLVAKRVKQLLATRDMHRDELARGGLVEQRGWRGRSGWHAASQLEAAEEAWAEADGDEEEQGREGGGDHEDAPGGGQGGGSLAGRGAQGHTAELVKALLVAALPQNVALRRRPGIAKHSTATGLDAIIAPQSVNAPPKGKPSSSSSTKTEDRFPSWWAYGSMQISNGQGFLRATTLVDPYHVALFAGLAVQQDESGALREVDGWIELRGSRPTLRVLGQLREGMLRCVHLRVLDPGAGLPEGGRRLLREVEGLLRLAAPRQERIAACLPESFAQYVERPPSLPASASRLRRPLSQETGASGPTARARPAPDGRDPLNGQRSQDPGSGTVWEAHEGGFQVADTTWSEEWGAAGHFPWMAAQAAAVHGGVFWPSPADDGHSGWCLGGAADMTAGQSWDGGAAWEGFPEVWGSGQVQ